LPQIENPNISTWTRFRGQGQVPFYLQETLGGDTALRGFRNFRFRDTNLLYLSAEYRWEVPPALEFAIFYDRGKVFADRADWDFTSLEKGFGIGIRAKTLDSLLLRLDFSRSREDTFRVSFKFSRSF
jgi:hemolysin activation/secretion protein